MPAERTASIHLSVLSEVQVMARPDQRVEDLLLLLLPLPLSAQPLAPLSLCKCILPRLFDGCQESVLSLITQEALNGTQPTSQSTN
jgi:hypothetical protein